MTDTRPPRVKFAVRYPTKDNRWRYETVDIPAYEGAVFVPMEHPPAVGDLISLWSRQGNMEGGPVFRVIERMWNHATYGSTNWPVAEQMPIVGPILDIIVEPADGLYRNEAPLPGEEDLA